MNKPDRKTREIERGTLDLQKLKEIGEKSTGVVDWYSHHWETEGRSFTVRGPFNRWFHCTEATNGYNDPVNYPLPKSVASRADDCDFAAAAMNSFLRLIYRVEEQEEAIKVAIKRIQALEDTISELGMQTQLYIVDGQDIKDKVLVALQNALDVRWPKSGLKVSDER